MSWTTVISENPFYEFTAIIAAAALLGAIGQLLRQPLIVMFIALGILLGPSGLDIVKSKDSIHLLAEIGIVILLFIVGLKLDLRIIKTLGKVALLTGLGQVFFTSVIGYFIGILLGFSALHSFYIAVALTFSSTIIIVKLLSDKKEIDSLHGQIAIGFLIVQDIVVILVMIILSAIGQSGGETLMADVLRILVIGVMLVAFTLFSMRFIIPKLSAFLAKSQELLTLFAIAWAVAFAAFCEAIGFSGEVGAFLAGVSLATSHFKETISSRLVSLRDFLLLFFFVHLGATLNMAVIGAQVPAALIFSVFVLVGNPIIVLVIMGYMGYRKRTSFLAGLTVAQISEFSLIFAGLGLAVGHITEETVGLITLVGLITIGLSTYLIIYAASIYRYLSPLLGIFERKIAHREDAQQNTTTKNYEVIIIGLGRFGNRLAQMLNEHPHISYLGVDFDPTILKKWQQDGKNFIYGDIEDPEFLAQIPYQKARFIISTVPDLTITQHLLTSLKQENYTGEIFVTATNDRDYHLLQSLGAQNILRPHKMAATNFYNDYMVKAIEHYNNQ